VDATGVYVAGETDGALTGQASQGYSDAFVVKLNAGDGSDTGGWIRQFGSAGYDYANGIAVDATGVYVAGQTGGALTGQASPGSDDAFVVKLSNNAPPQLTAAASAVVIDEGQTAGNTGTWSDPDADAVSLSASAGTVIPNHDGTWSWSCATTDGPAQSQTVTITATDDHGGISTIRFTLTVRNVAPAVGATPTAPVYVDAALVGTGTFTDPGADTWIATVDYGDGAGAQPLSLSSKTFALYHAYAAPRTFTVTVAVNDGTDTGTASFSVAIVQASQPGDLVHDLNALDPNVAVTIPIATAPGTVNTWVGQIAALTPKPAGAPVSDLVLNLDHGTYGLGRKLDVPSGYRVIINGVKGSVVFQGSSPALDVASGEVLVENGVQFVQATDAPTILVEGGHLVVRDSTIEESSTASRAAVEVIGGLADFGGDTLIVHGPGTFIHQAATGSLLLADNTYRVDGTTLPGDFSMGADPLDSTTTVLTVTGTAGDDLIEFSPGSLHGEIAASLNGVTLGSFSPTGRLVAHGGEGADDIQVAGSITLPAWLYGEGGDDRLKGGDGPDVLLGGQGDDLLVGGGGRDLLIGGTGADRIVGNVGDDLLIAGTTAYDAVDAALAAIMAEWTRTDRTYPQRVDRLRGSDFTAKLDDTTVFSDAAVDILTGSAGQDWFLFNERGDRGDTVKDKVTDLSAAEYSSDLDWINR
jgi:Ca2+-binding RTX toxin-like protein